MELHIYIKEKEILKFMNYNVKIKNIYHNKVNN